MNDMKRKDKLFIVVFALSALVMAIANPTDYDIRSVAWDIAMLMIFVSAVFWFLGEVADSIVVGVVGVVPVVHKTKSRHDMIELVGEMTGVGKESLSRLSDVELAGIVGSANAVAKNNTDVPSIRTVSVASLNVLTKVLNRLYKGLASISDMILGKSKASGKSKKK